MEDVEEAATGYTHSLVLKKDGSLWTWEKNDFGQLGHAPASEPQLASEKLPKFWENSEFISGIGCGTNFSWATTNTGLLYMWGFSCRVKITEKFLVKLPRSSTRDLWEIIFQWLFLGISDSDSVVSGLPVEVIFHVAFLMKNRYFCGGRGVGKVVGVAKEEERERQGKVGRGEKGERKPSDQMESSGICTLS
jgi:hypothetical protein